MLLALRRSSSDLLPAALLQGLGDSIGFLQSAFSSTVPQNSLTKSST
jgi:hypothetical protein